jgi:hypothetical protein
MDLLPRTRPREFLQGLESIDVMTTVACAVLHLGQELPNVERVSLSPSLAQRIQRLVKMASNSGKRIAFTGRSGKAGRHVLPYLLS